MELNAEQRATLANMHPAAIKAEILLAIITYGLALSEKFCSAHGLSLTASGRFEKA